MTRPIAIAAIWDRTQVDPELELRIYRQVKGAFGVNELNMTPVAPWLEGGGATQFDTLQEAVDGSFAGAPCVRAFLCPSGDCNLEDIPVGDDPLVLVIGDTKTSPASLAGPGDFVVNLPAPFPVELYGVSAAAAALAELYRTGRL